MAEPMAAPGRTDFADRARRAADAALSWALDVRHATYSWALFRIVMGGTVLLVLATSWLDRHYLWGIGSRFIDPVATDRGYPWFFEAVFVKSNAVAFDAAYYALAAVAVAFVLGWRTRVVAPVLLLLWMGLSVNSTLLTNGGDTIMRVTLLFACFADLSARWSLDARRRRRAPTVDDEERIVPRWLATLLHNTALVLCCWQILLVYAGSAFYKLDGVEWRNGTASYYSLVLDVFRPIPWLNDLAATWDLPIILLTYATMGLQLLFPVFLVWRPTRIVALVGVTFLHLGIGLFLGLWSFSLAMIACDFLFVRDSTWREIRGYARDGWARMRGAKRAAAEPGPEPEGRPAAVGGPGYPV